MSSLQELLPYRPKRQEPRIRLFCLPFAGGAAATFKTWSAALPDYVDVCAVELPGRGTRFGEELIQTSAALRAEFAPLEALPNLPTVFFGHSMGGRIAFMLARAGWRADAVIVSGARAAHLPLTQRSTMPKPAMVAHLRKLGGTPRDVLEDEEMLDLMLPIVRADFAILESLHITRSETVTVPMTALAATDDVEASVDDVAQWQAHAGGDFRFVEFETGGHFFVTSRPEAVLTEVRRVIEETLARVGV